MKKITLFGGLAVALAISLFAQATWVILSGLLPTNAVLEIVITGCSGLYLCYLLSHSRLRNGKITALALWFGLSLLIAWWSNSVLVIAMYQLVALWLLRSIFFYGNTLSALLDLGLLSLGGIACLWALFSTGALWLGVWCFFLLQSLVGCIPHKVSIKRPYRAVRDDSIATPRQFDRAFRSAEIALTQLTRSRT